jgi:hypothetical protein
MAINTTRLAQKIGKIIGGLNETNTGVGTTLPARVATIYAQYTTYGPEDVTGLFSARDAQQQAQSSWIDFYKSLISAAIVTEVELDRVLPASTIDYALPEWVRQMVIAGDSFQDAPPTLGTVTAVGSPTGTYTFLTTAFDGTGAASDLVVPDLYLLQVVTDNERGGTRWAETFSVVGKAAASDPAAWDYPIGSGVNTTIDAIDPAAGTTLTTDPSFDEWTTNTPDNWTIEAGVAGTSVFKVADDPRDGADGFALRFVGDGATVLKIRQAVTVEASTVYQIYYRVKKVTDPGTDWGVTVRLVDDDTGTAVTGTSVLSATAASVASAWTNVVTGTFATPATMPVNCSIEIVFSQYNAPTTAAAATAECYVDWVNIVAPTLLYTNGPSISIWSGTTEGVYGDSWTWSVTLGAAPSTFMVRGIDRLLNLSQFSVRLPTAGSPTQADSLIS